MVATSTKSKSLMISTSLARKISSLTVATLTEFSSQIVATYLFVERLLKLSTLKLLLDLKFVNIVLTISTVGLV